LRDAFTDLVLELREKTGLPLELAHNCTVTGRNIDFIAELVRWFLAKPRRTQIWRNLSFLPEANTGRTTYGIDHRSKCGGNVSSASSTSGLLVDRRYCNDTLVFSRRGGEGMPLEAMMDFSGT